MYDEEFNPMYFEDSDFYFRAAKAGFKAAWNFKHTVRHIGHQTIGSFKDSQRKAAFDRCYKLFVDKWKPYMPRNVFMGDLERLVKF